MRGTDRLVGTAKPILLYLSPCSTTHSLYFRVRLESFSSICYIVGGKAGDLTVECTFFCV